MHCLSAGLSLTQGCSGSHVLQLPGVAEQPAAREHSVQSQEMSRKLCLQLQRRSDAQTAALHSSHCSSSKGNLAEMEETSEEPQAAGAHPQGGTNFSGC